MSKKEEPVKTVLKTTLERLSTAVGFPEQMPKVGEIIRFVQAMRDDSQRTVHAFV